MKLYHGYKLTILIEHSHCTRSNCELDSRKATWEGIWSATNRSFENEGTILKYFVVALLGVWSYGSRMVDMGIYGVKVTCLDSLPRFTTSVNYIDRLYLKMETE